MTKIVLKWIDCTGESHTEVMEECFKKASKKTFDELKKMCMKYIDDHLHEYGHKEWIIRFVPYQVIKLFEDGKMTCWWYASDYLKKKGVER